MFTSIGRAKIDFEMFVQDAAKIIAYEKDTDHSDRIWNSIYALFPDQRTDEFKIVDRAYDKFYHHWHPGFMCYEGETEDEGKARELAEDVEHLEKALRPIRDYISEFNIPVKCLHMDERIAIVTAGGDEPVIVLPSRYVEVEEYRNYDTRVLRTTCCLS